MTKASAGVGVGGKTVREVLLSANAEEREVMYEGLALAHGQAMVDELREVVRREIAAAVVEPLKPEPEAEPDEVEEAEVVLEDGLPPQSKAAQVKDPDIRFLNTQHAIINNIGGKTMIASWEPSPMKPERKEIVYQRQSDFQLRYANQSVAINTQDLKGNAKIGYRPLGQYWIGHKDRRQHAGVGFWPGIDGEVNNCINLWRGWGVKPKHGDWRLIRRHIEEVIADGDAETAKYVLDWITWAIQNPDKRAEVALALIGEKGSGKGTLGRLLWLIFGDEHSYEASGADELVGKFSGFLEACILFIVDEASWGEKYKACIGRLQGLITEPTYSIEPKGIEKRQIPNRLHIIMLAEPGWVIPAGRYERRYAVVEVSSAKLRDVPYFTALHHQINNGGAEAMFAELREVDLAGWHPRKIPEAILRGPAIQAQQAHAMKPMEQWYLTLLHDAKLPNAIAGRPNKTFTKSLTDDAKERFPKLKWDLTEVSLYNFLKDKSRIGVECEKYRAATANGWSFPPLAECRAGWTEIYGAVAWEVGGAEVDWGHKPKVKPRPQLVEPVVEPAAAAAPGCVVLRPSAWRRI